MAEARIDERGLFRVQLVAVIRDGGIALRGKVLRMVLIRGPAPGETGTANLQANLIEDQTFNLVAQRIAEGRTVTFQ